MKTGVAVKYLDKTLLEFREAGVLNSNGKTYMPTKADNEEVYLWLRACKKLVKDGYLNE